MRTLLIGIDAACLPIVEPLLEAGDLPSLERLFADGTSGPLASGIPPWTPSAWPSLYTGMNPGKHGLYNFLSFSGYDWDVVNATLREERALWEILSDEGLTSVVVNVPVTHPPRPFDGALVPGYTAPENPTCHPDGVLADVEAAVGEYPIYLPPTDEETNPVRDYLDLVGLRGRAFRYLADRFDPAFGFIQFQMTDTVFHKRPGDHDAVRAVYQAVDREIGEICSQCAPDTVIVASDHGMGQYERSTFRVNEFLRREGFVKTRRGGRGMPTWATIRESSLKSSQDGTAGSRGIPERAMATAARFGLTTQRVLPVIERLGLLGPVRQIVPRSVGDAGEEQVDFPASTAYMRSRSELGIRINLEGREPDGTVSPEEYEAVRSALIERLEAVTAPDGEPVFEDVAPREEYYWGPAADRAVDVVTVPNGFEYFLSARLAGELFDEPVEPWNHKREGVIAATGAAVDPSARPADAHLYDVAPTILATLGIPRDERMDGQALPFVADAGTKPYPAYESRRIQRTDDPAVEKRLADLGYIDQP